MDFSNSTVIRGVKMRLDSRPDPCYALFMIERPFQEVDSKKILFRMAQNFVWWKSPDEAMRNPTDLICRALKLGTWRDIEELEKVVDKDRFRDALRHAPAGLFDGASWAYWHYRLGMLPVPPLPQRAFLKASESEGICHPP